MANTTAFQGVRIAMITSKLFCECRGGSASTHYPGHSRRAKTAWPTSRGPTTSYAHTANQPRPYVENGYLIKLIGVIAFYFVAQACQCLSKVRR